MLEPGQQSDGRLPQKSSILLIRSPQRTRLFHSAAVKTAFRSDTYRAEKKAVFIHVWGKQNPVDFVYDPINAHVVAVRHIGLIDEDRSL